MNKNDTHKNEFGKLYNYLYRIYDFEKDKTVLVDVFKIIGQYYLKYHGNMYHVVGAGKTIIHKHEYIVITRDFSYFGKYKRKILLINEK